MAIIAKHKNVKFGVGDNVKVSYLVKEGDKQRTQIFNGVVIAIKGRAEGKTFTVRRIGSQKIGIERIFPLQSPNVEGVEVVRKGLRGVQRAKLYYLREKSKKESEKIFKRAKNKKDDDVAEKDNKLDKDASKKKTSKSKKTLKK